jgi:hypothetical protein
VGVCRLIVERRTRAAAVCGAAAIATIAFTVPLWFESSSAQARAIWPNDPRLLHSDAVASYMRAHTRPDDQVFTLWAAADLYYLAERRPAVRYMWFRNIEAIDGALTSARRTLAERRPALVVVVQPPRAIDPSGATTRILNREYRLVTRVAGTRILERRALRR